MSNDAHPLKEIPVKCFVYRHTGLFCGAATFGLAAFLVAAPAISQAQTWTNANPGDLLNAVNWGGTTPNSVDAVANIATNPTNAGDFTLDGTMTVGTLDYSNSQSRQITGFGNLRFGTSSGNASFNVENSALDIATTFVTLDSSTEMQIGADVTAHIQSFVQGTGELVKTGPGTLVLDNPNSFYTGGTRIEGGTLRGDTLTNFGSPSSFGYGDFFSSGGTLKYTGASTTSNRSFEIVDNGDFMIDVATAATTLTLSGTIYGGGAGMGTQTLIKTGTGTLQITGETVLPITIVNEGLLKFTDNADTFHLTVSIGSSATDNGTMTIGDGSNNTKLDIWAGNLTVGRYGTGTVNVVGGGSVVSGNTDPDDNSIFVNLIGDKAGSHGTLNVGGGIGNSHFTGLGLFVIGSEGDGVLNISGGGNVISPGTRIGFWTGSHGSANVGGGVGNSVWSATNLIVGLYGTGEFSITGGGIVTSEIAGVGKGNIVNEGETRRGSGTVTVGNGTGSATWTNLAGGSYSGELSVGDGGDGILNIRDGGSVSTTICTIGENHGSSLFPVIAYGIGTVNVGNGTGSANFTVVDELLVGVDGTATLNINAGGLVSAAKLDGGNAASSVNFNGGTLRITTTDSASNKINLLSGGGTIDVPTAESTLTISSAITGSGSLTKAGAGSLTLTGTSNYGSTNVAAGTLNITAGASVASSGENYIGKLSGSNGTVNVGEGTGNSTWASSQLFVGESGTGTLNITGGGTVTNMLGGFIAFNTGSSGTVNVGGGTGNSTWNIPNTFSIGRLGAAELNITGGGHVSNADSASIDSYGNATVNVGGGTGSSTWNCGSNLFIGSVYTGTLNITGGGSVTSYSGSLGYGATSHGTVNVGGGTGSSTWTTESIGVGLSSGLGELNINSGGRVITGSLSGNSRSSINFNGGTLRTGGTVLDETKINLLAGGGTLDVPTAGSTFTIKTVISGVGSLTKTGAGTLVFSGTDPYTGAQIVNIYTGDTTVNAGTLDITNPHTTGANYSVASGANLITNNVRVTNGLTVDGTATIRANGGTAGASKVEVLAIGGNGKLNLKDNDFVIGTGSIAVVRSQIKAGAGGAIGITSDVVGFGATTGFGYAAGNDPNLNPLLAGSLSGQTYDADSVLVKFTYRGDADLDGDSDLDDLGRWANSFTGDLGLGALASPTTLWTQGDWDYDGDTDLDDLGFWSSTFTGDLGSGGLSVYAPNAPEGAIAALSQMGVTAVPEPGAASLLLIGWGVVLRRLRR